MFTSNAYIEMDGYIIAVHPAVLLLWKAEMGEDVKVAETLRGDFHLVTSFLGIDHNFSGNGPPLIYASFLLQAGESEPIERYSTREQAVIGHDRLVRGLLERKTVVECLLEDDHDPW